MGLNQATTPAAGPSPVAPVPATRTHLQLTAFGDPAEVLRLVTEPMPVPGPHEVLVALEAAPLNQSDFLLVRGTYGVRPALPAPVGSEGVGRVVQLGPQAEATLLQQRVLVLPTYEQGTWASHVVVPVRNLVPVSNSADPEQLAMLGINPPTAYLLLRQYVNLMPGDWIAQTGGNSAVGQYVIALAKMAGINTLSVVRREEASAQVRQLGGTAVMLLGDDLEAQLAQALGGQQLRLVLDTLGGTIAGTLAKFVQNHGKLVGYSSEFGHAPVLAPQDLFFRQLSYHGFWLIDWVRNAPAEEKRQVYQRLSELVAGGQLHAAVAATYPLADFAQAIAHAQQGRRDGKVLFKFN
ncbi:zinc-dependent alcohol dehydrogenase family protein [Hymenobacter daeguensis]